MSVVIMSKEARSPDLEAAKAIVEASCERARDNIESYRDFMRALPGHGSDNAIAMIQYVSIFMRCIGYRREEVLPVMTVALARAYEFTDDKEDKPKKAHGPN